MEWTFLPPSAYRYAVRTVSFPTRIAVGIWRTVSEDSSRTFNLGSREARTGDIWFFSIEASNFCQATLPCFCFSRFHSHAFAAHGSNSGFLPDTRTLGRYLINFLTKRHLLLAFPADCLHPAHFHVNLRSRSVGYSEFPANSQILLRLAKLTLGPL